MLFFADATIYVGGLDDKVSESLMWELFVQAGPVGKHLLLFIYIRIIRYEKKKFILINNYILQ